MPDMDKRGAALNLKRNPRTEITIGHLDFATFSQPAFVVLTFDCQRGFIAILEYAQHIILCDLPKLVYGKVVPENLGQLINIHLTIPPLSAFRIVPVRRSAQCDKALISKCIMTNTARALK